MSEPKKRGPKPKAPEDLVQRRNVSLDAEVQEMIVQLQGDLEGKFGFVPTLSQTVRYAIREARNSLKE